MPQHPALQRRRENSGVLLTSGWREARDAAVELLTCTAAPRQLTKCAYVSQVAGGSFAAELSPNAATAYVPQAHELKPTKITSNCHKHGYLCNYSSLDGQLPLEEQADKL